MQKVVLGLLGVFLGHYIFNQHKQSQRKRVVSPKNERVVIIGASSGIGRDCALQYAARGAKLVLFARRASLLEELKQQCMDGGSPFVDIVIGDVTLEKDLEKLAQQTKTSLGGVDTVIYCAGMISVRPFLDSCGIQVSKVEGGFSVTENGKKGQEVDQALERITTINYFSAVWSARLFLPMLISSSKAPNFITISSMAGKAGAPTRSLYVGSKHAVQGFFDSIRVELSPYNVHIGLVCPGTVDTDLRQSAVDKSLGQGEVAGSKKNKLSPATVAARIIRASDAREREVYIPVLMGYGAVWGNVIAKSLVDWFAARKYKQ